MVAVAIRSLQACLSFEIFLGSGREGEMKKFFWRYWLPGFFLLLTAGLMVWTWISDIEFQAVVSRLP